MNVTRFGLKRLLSYLTMAVVAGLTIWFLVWMNEQMTVRYQAVGVVLDTQGKPLNGVEIILVLTPPPPAGLQRDKLFQEQGVAYAQYGVEGELRRGIGPSIGLSGASGGYLVRAVGRTGATQAIRMGLDDSGRPPFDMAWLVFRRDGAPDVTRTTSILGWRKAPGDWGKFANRLPVFTLD